MQFDFNLDFSNFIHIKNFSTHLNTILCLQNAWYTRKQPT